MGVKAREARSDEIYDPVRASRIAKAGYSLICSAVLFCLAASLMAGCSSYPVSQSGALDSACGQIGCNTGGLTFYPHEHPCDRPEPGQHYRLDSLELECF